MGRNEPRIAAKMPDVLCTSHVIHLGPGNKTPEDGGGISSQNK